MKKRLKKRRMIQSTKASEAARKEWMDVLHDINGTDNFIYASELILFLFRTEV